MQADYRDNLSEKEREAMNKELGFGDDPVPYDEEKMKRALGHENVKQVRVFKGMTDPDPKKVKAAKKKKRKATRAARKKSRK